MRAATAAVSGLCQGEFLEALGRGPLGRALRAMKCSCFWNMDLMGFCVSTTYVADSSDNIPFALEPGGQACPLPSHVSLSPLRPNPDTPLGLAPAPAPQAPGWTQASAGLFLPTVTSLHHADPLPFLTHHLHLLVQCG